MIQEKSFFCAKSIFYCFNVEICLDLSELYLYRYLSLKENFLFTNATKHLWTETKSAIIHSTKKNNQFSTFSSFYHLCNWYFIWMLFRPFLYVDKKCIKGVQINLKVCLRKNLFFKLFVWSIRNFTQSLFSYLPTYFIIQKSEELFTPISKFFRRFSTHIFINFSKSMQNSLYLKPIP